MSGEFIVVNKHLLVDLVKLGLWNENLKNEIMRANGSIQNIEGIPQNIKELYKTVWELSMKDIIDMAGDRGLFIDQSQSMNLFMEAPNKGKLTSMHMYAWKKGLKTGLYYLRTKSATDAIKFTVQKQAKSQMTPVVNSGDAVHETAQLPVAEENLGNDMSSFEETTASINAKKMAEAVKKSYTDEETIACSIDDPDGCEACGS